MKMKRFLTGIPEAIHDQSSNFPRTSRESKESVDLPINHHVK